MNKMNHLYKKSLDQFIVVFDPGSMLGIMWEVSYRFERLIYLVVLGSQNHVGIVRFVAFIIGLCSTDVMSIWVLTLCGVEFSRGDSRVVFLLACVPCGLSVSCM